MTHGKQASIPHVAGSQHGIVEHDRRSQCGVTPTGTRDSGGGQDRVAHRSSALPRVGPSQDGVRLHPRVQATSTGTTSPSIGSTSISVVTTSNSSSSTLPSGYVRARDPPRSLVRSKRFSETTQRRRAFLNRSTDEVARNGRFEDAHILTASIHASLTPTSSSCESFSLHR